MGQLEALQRKYAAAARTLAAQSRMLNHLKDTVQERESALQKGQARLGSEGEWMQSCSVERRFPRGFPQVEWLAALNEQRDRIKSLHALVIQLSSSENAPGQQQQERDETGSAEAREKAYEEKYKRAKNLLKLQAQHVSQLQGAWCFPETGGEAL